MTHHLSATLLTAMAIAAATSTASAQGFQKPDPDKWYRLETRYSGSDPRLGRCIQYYPDGTAHPDMLWSATQLDTSNPDSDYQYWRFEPSPDNPNRYAMICKAAPDGYVNPTPSPISDDARWYYVTTPPADATAESKYGFMFMTDGPLSGIDGDTGVSYCAIATDATIGGKYRYMNCGNAEQDYAINLWYATSSDETNEWLFNFVERYDPTRGISDIPDTDAEDITIYDLMGRRVTNPSHGIYIINGKKVAL